MPGPAQKLFQENTFWSLPWEERKKRIAALDPSFASLSPADQDIGLQSVQRKYAPKESFGEAATHDIGLGYRAGKAHLAQTAANVLGFIPTETTRGEAKELAGYARRTEPAPQDLSGRDTLASQIFQGIGSAGPGIVEYAPALLARRYAPIGAALIGAASEAHHGRGAAFTEALKQGTTFYLGGKAASLPTRTTRAIGTAALMAVPAAVESGGDINKAVAAGALGLAMGAVGGRQQPKLRAPGEVRSSIMRDFRRALSPRGLGPQAEETARIVSARAAELAQKGDQAEFAVRAARKHFDKLPSDKSNPGGMHNDAIDFVDKIETGNIQSIPQYLRPYAKVLRDAFDERRKIL